MFCTIEDEQNVSEQTTRKSKCPSKSSWIKPPWWGWFKPANQRTVWRHPSLNTHDLLETAVKLSLLCGLMFISKKRPLACEQAHVGAQASSGSWQGGKRPLRISALVLGTSSRRIVRARDSKVSLLVGYKGPHTINTANAGSTRDLVCVHLYFGATILKHNIYIMHILTIRIFLDNNPWTKLKFRHYL